MWEKFKAWFGDDWELIKAWYAGLGTLLGFLLVIVALSKIL